MIGSVRKKLLIGLALYLACGVAFGLTTERHKYMCPPSVELFGGDSATERGGSAILVIGDAEGEDLLREVPQICFPIISTADRLQWVAITSPAWLPLLVRNIVRGDGVPIGNIVLGT